MDERDKKLAELFGNLSMNLNKNESLDPNTTLKIAITDEKTGKVMAEYHGVKGGLVMASEEQVNDMVKGFRLGIMGEEAEILMCYFSIKRYFRAVLVEKMGEARVREVEFMAKKFLGDQI